MAIFESLFDVTYLSLVIGLGVRLLLEKTKGAKLFGIMAILLGMGDAFHLVPRIVAHLSPFGFETYSFVLSWGQFITSITMTVFYVLYYYFYRRQSGDTDKNKMLIIYALALVRIILVLMPMNNWGTAEGNYMFGIYRNIPFAIMGALLIYWSYQERVKEGLANMWILILLSFLFYIPVVLWSDTYPIIGALMMPKTVAYLLIVVFGYKYYICAFERINLLGIAFTNLIMGLLAGVFYREFSKFYLYYEPTHLGKIHGHVLTLGFIGMLLLYLLTGNMSNEQLQKLKRPIYVMESGLVFTVVNMFVLGVHEIVSLIVEALDMNRNTINMSALNGMSGLGHILLSVGLIWTLVKVFNIEKLIETK